MKSISEVSSHAITWRGPEFLYKPKTPLWYLNVSVYFFLVLIALFFLKNIPGGIIVALLFWYFIAQADARPNIIDYKIDKNGIKVGEKTFDFSEIHSFSVDFSHAVPIIVIDLNYQFSVPITIVAKKGNIDAVTDYLLHYIPLETNFSFIRWLTHWLHY